MDDKSISKDSEDFADFTSSTAPDLEKSQPYPHRQYDRGRAARRPITIAPTLTIKHSPHIGDRITRVNSTAARRDAARGDASARTVAEFRTLSIHVTDTQKGASTTASKKQADKAVKGKYLMTPFWAVAYPSAKISRLWTSTRYPLRQLNRGSALLPRTASIPSRLREGSRATDRIRSVNRRTSFGKSMCGICHYMVSTDGSLQMARIHLWGIWLFAYHRSHPLLYSLVRNFTTLTSFKLMVA
jgi:hypothetical protein